MVSDPVPVFRRLLPFDYDYQHTDALGDILNPQAPPNPPAYAELGHV